MKPTRSLPMVSAILLVVLAAASPAQENSWISHGPRDFGFVFDVVISDADAYAATTNGVFRSRDGGASWQPYGLAGERVFRVLATPRSEAVWALVERSDDSRVLYSSRDGGGTWAPVPGLPTIHSVALDPWHPSTLFAGATGRTIWRSTDSGTTWQLLTVFPGQDDWMGHFVFDEQATYVRAFDETYRYYRSSDGGASWTRLVSPLSYVFPLAAGAAPGVVYANGPEGFCRSTDSATTWTCSSAKPPDYPFHILEVPDGSRRILAVGQRELYVSDDQGATWSQSAPELSPVGLILSVASDPSGSLVLVGTSDGILRSQDRGGRWAYSSEGVSAVSLYSLALDPNDPSTIWTATGYVGPSIPQLFRSTDDGLSWEPAAGPAVELNSGTLIIAPGQPSRLYAAGGSAVYRSDDAGESWTSSTPPNSRQVKALAVDPSSRDRVLAAVSVSTGHFDAGSIHRSEDGARTWTGEAALEQEIFSLLFDGRNPGTVYAGSYYHIDPGYYAYPSGGSIFVSRDSGATFSKNPLDFRSEVVAIVADPSLDSGLYAATSSTGVFRSTDNGQHWDRQGLSTPSIGRLISLVADPVRPGRLYATTESGLYRSIDSARIWQPFSAGLGSLDAGPLAITPDGRWLHVGTSGGSAFSLDLTFSYPCVAAPTRLCLVENRYAVELSARRGESPLSSGIANALADNAGYFALPFVTNDPKLAEVAVKMLPDGSFGSGAPVFFTSLTTLPFTLRVTDTVTGLIKEYRNAAAPLCGGTDIAFGHAASMLAERVEPLAPAPGEGELRLLGDRFELSLTARHAGTGRTATGHGVFVNDRFGYFSFPNVTGDSAFPEVLVKMLDFRWLDGKFLMFHAGLTGFDYTLTVTNTVTGAVRTYSGRGDFCGSTESDAFAD